MTPLLHRLLRNRTKALLTRPVRLGNRAVLRLQTLEDRATPATFTVTSTADSGAGSLRKAIDSAEAATGPDTITFDPTVFATPQTITLESALTQITGDLTITGPGANLLTVQRDAGASSQFGVLSSTAANLSVSGLTLSGGNTTGDGGGLYAFGNVTLDSVVISGNTAGHSGGGVFMGPNGFLTVRNSTISGNTASGRSGGGIYFFFDGSLFVQNSTISGNKALATTDTYGGGGIYFFGQASPSAPPGFLPNTLVLRNSTIANNTSASGGGGIMLDFFTGTLLVQDCTISGNVANSTGTGHGGGGIDQDYPAGNPGTITVQGSVVSGNTNANGPDILSAGTVNVNSSAVGSATGFTPSGTSGNNLAYGANLNLGPLQDNGGPTQTMSPGPGSPLLDAGVALGFLTTDQRGPTFVRSYGNGPDIGALEVQPPSPVSITTAANPTNANTINFTVRFNQSVPNLSASNFSLTRTGTVAGAVDTPTGGGTVWTVPVTPVTGDGTLQLTLTNSAGVVGGLTGLPLAGPVVTIDHTPPTAVSLVPAGASPTNAGNVQFTVTFSEPVVGLTPANFTVTPNGITGASVTAVGGSGTTWTVAVATGTGDGTLQLTLTNPAGVTDLAGNTLTGPFPAGATVTIDKTPPTVQTITPVGASPTNAGSVQFTVTFSEAVVGLAPANFAATTDGGVTGAAVTNVAGSGKTYTVTVNTGSGDGNLRLDLANSTGLTDVAGNPVSGLPFAGQSFAIDKTPPAVRSIVPVGTGFTNASSAQFTVTFTEPVSGLTASDFAVAVSGASTGAITNFSGSGATYTITVDVGPGEGTVQVNLNTPAGVFDAAGNLLAGPFTGSPETIDHTDPVAESAGPAGPSVTASATTQFAVTFSEPVMGAAPDNFMVVGAGVTGASVTGVSGTGSTLTVTVDTGTGDGSISLFLRGARGITDLAGNPLDVTEFPTTPITIDKTPPTAVSIVRAGPAATNAAQVAFTVTFSEPVSGLTADDFKLTSSGAVQGAAIAGLSSADGRVYTVTVGTGTGDGGLRLDLAKVQGVTDRAGLQVTAPLTGPTYTVDKTPPRVTVAPAAGQLGLTGTLPVRFAVTFTEPVSGFGADDVVLGGTAGPGQITVTGSGAAYTVEVGGLAQSGSVTISVRAGAASDPAGNVNPASTEANAVSFVRRTAAAGDVYTTVAGVRLTVGAGGGVLANDADPDGRPLTAVLVAAPPASVGGVSLNPDGSFTFVPAPGFVGNATFTYSASNGSVLSPPATVTVAVARRVTLTAVSAGPGGGPEVVVYNADGSTRFAFFVYAPTFTGGVSVATGDVNGDGVDDIVTGAGVGGGPHVRVFDGVTGNEIASFFAYDVSARGGVSVALGDVDGDGRDEIVTGAGPGGGPHVKVFDGSGNERLGFFAYDPSFTGGVSVAAGDVDGDGRAEVVTGPLAGGGPHVEVFDGTTGALIRSFFAFDPETADGVSVAVGDAYGDGKPDVFVGSGATDEVHVFRGSNGTRITGFDFTDPTATGVRVATADTNGDGQTDTLVMATGPGGPPRVRRMSLATFTPLGDQTDFPADFLGGLYVG